MSLVHDIPLTMRHTFLHPPLTTTPFAMDTRTSWQNCPTTRYKHPPIVFLPPTCCSFYPSRHTVMSVCHLWLRMNCAAHANPTFPFPFALSLFNLPFGTVVA